MMMRRFITTLTLSACMALNVFSQYYSKVILDSYTNSRILSNAIIDNQNFISSIGGFSYPDINVEETIIAKTYFDGKITDSLKFENQWFSITGRNYKSANDTIFVGSKDIVEKNGIYNWYYSILDKNLYTIYKSSFRLPPTNLYGLELTKNDEVILWGNGFDPSIQNTNDSIKVVWLRIKRDGTLISGPHYWKPSDTKKFGIATDASVNADGNMVFIRKSRASTGITAYYRAIYEIDENDNVTQKVKFDDERPLSGDYARFCVTHDRGYVTTKGTKEYMPIFLKFNQVGDTVWSCPIPQKYSHHSGYPNMRNIDTEEITRIRQASNGDIIFCGRNTFIDTIYNHIYKRRMLMSDLGGAFWGRISPDGKLKWVHYMVSPKNATDCHYITPNDITEMPNGDLLLGGKIGTSPDSMNFTYQAWIMRVNDKGCFDDNCSHVDKWWYFPEQFPVATQDLHNYSNDLALYPNPFGQSVYISLPEDVVYPLYYQITHMSGQTVSIGTLNDTTQNIIETGHLTSGTYIVGIKDKSGKIYYQKGIKI